MNDLRRTSAQLREELRTAIDRVVDRGWFILGPELEAFESEFASFCGTTFCMGVANGTDALELALRSLHLPSGSEIATVANAGGYVTTAILQAGFHPLFVDVSDGSMTMDPADLRTTLNERCSAIVITHLYGRLAAMEALLREAKVRNLPVIEDCAQAHGASLSGRKAGSWGVLGCFSFYPTKNLGALGDAGAVVTSDAGLAERIRRLRQYGWVSKYRSEEAGGRNSRLDEIQAAVLRARLPFLDQWNARRREIAAAYTNAFADTDLRLPAVSGNDYVAHLYVARTGSRDSFRSRLAQNGVATDVHYPIPDYSQESFTRMAGFHSPLRVTEDCAAKVVSLPCFPELTDCEIERVTKAVHASVS